VIPTSRRLARVPRSLALEQLGPPRKRPVLGARDADLGDSVQDLEREARQAVLERRHFPLEAELHEVHGRHDRAGDQQAAEPRESELPVVPERLPEVKDEEDALHDDGSRVRETVSRMEETPNARFARFSGPVFPENVTGCRRTGPEAGRT
jgi:hypothetical protein